MKRMNLHRPATDTGLIRIAAIMFVILGIIITGVFDCRFEFIPVGFC